METRRFLNDAQPRPLFLAQFALYAWAFYDVAHSILAGPFSFWTIVFGVFRGLGAYGLSNERVWGYWMAIVVAAVSFLPVITAVVNNPALAWRPDVWVLVAFPAVVLSLLTHPVSRDFERIWFT